jgi:hypothetical protein
VRRQFRFLFLYFSLIPASAWADLASVVPKSLLQFEWVIQGERQTLRSWGMSDFLQLKKALFLEKDPTSHRLEKWQGVPLTQLIEKELRALSSEKRSAVDLIVLKTAQGAKALIPRSLITKYPISLGFRLSGGVLQHELHSIIPWTSKSKILQENLPVESYFLSQVNQVELTNFHSAFGAMYLKRRTDPSAMKGEKIFVQQCGACHREGSGAISVVSLRSGSGGNAGDDRPYFERFLKNTAHRGSKVKEPVWKSVIRYLDAFRLENPPQISRGVTSPQVKSE